MSNQLAINEYVCGVCEGVFEKGWSDEDADIEKQGLWGDLKPEKAMTVCDDCFNELFPSAYAETN